MKVIISNKIKWLLIGVLHVCLGNMIVLGQNIGNEYMVPFPNDTLLYMTDFLPKGVRCDNFGSDSTKWDLNGVKAPYIRKTVVNQVEEPSSLFFGSTGTIAIGKNAVEYLKIGGDSVSSFGLDRIDLFGDGHQYYGKYITPRIYRPLESAPDHQPTLLSNKLIYQIDLTNLPPSLKSQLPYPPDSVRVITSIEERTISFKDITLDLNLERNNTILYHKLIVLTTILETRKSNLDWQNITRFVRYPSLFKSDTIRKSSFYAQATQEHVATIFYKSLTEPDRIIYKAPDTFKDLTIIQDFNSGLYFFPNPYTVGTLRCELNIPAAGLYTLRIVNLVGTEIKRENYYLEANKTFDLDLTALSKGTYFIALEQDKNHVISTKRLLVIKS